MLWFLKGIVQKKKKSYILSLFTPLSCCLTLSLFLNMKEKKPSGFLFKGNE